MLVRIMWLCSVAGLTGLPARALDQVPTTLEDFFIPGTQPIPPEQDFDEFLESDWCGACHGLDDPRIPVMEVWRGSMMAQAARDPLFWACLAVANQDARFAGDLCIRCHTPGAWLEGRSTPTDGSALIDKDFDGVNCNFCHRAVDPVYTPGESPPVDEDILAALDADGLIPTSLHNGSYVVDLEDRRRGPYQLEFNPHDKDTLQSPFHRDARLCASCHDVSNPLYSRQEDGTYALNNLDQEHPSQDKYDMFPIERTFGEWSQSAFAAGGVDMEGRFGGRRQVVSTCQDCHMPDTAGYGCIFGEYRTDLPPHEFSGGATWVLDAVLNLYPNEGIRPEAIAAGIERSISMLQRSATLEAFDDGCRLLVQVTNETGHKLPTGYPEGRRMWIEVQFRDDDLSVIAVRGHYDDQEADLATADTRVYEVELGVDEAVSQLTGIPVGPGFHFAVNNVVYKDNRIPPRGFTNEGFASVQASPVGATYDDGQYWDDVRYHLPPGATSAIVSLYYQTSSKKYIEFLRDENRTNDAGDVLHEQWALLGKSPPVLMGQTVISDLVPARAGDADCDGDVDLDDYAILGPCYAGPTTAILLGCGSADIDGDGDADLRDHAAFQAIFLTP